MDIGSILFGLQTLVSWINRLLGDKDQTTGSGGIDIAGSLIKNDLKIETGIRIDNLNLMLNILSKIDNPQLLNYKSSDRSDRSITLFPPTPDAALPHNPQTQPLPLSSNPLPSVGSRRSCASPFTMGLYFRVDHLDWVIADQPFRIANGHLLVPVTRRNATVDFCEIWGGDRRVEVRLTNGEPASLRPEWHRGENFVPLQHGVKVQADGSDWCVTPVALDQPVLLDDKAASLISFKREIAQAVWCLERTHSGRASEKYWLIVSSQAT